MWCPSATLSVWANAWLAGYAAPDDVLDALSHWAPTQSVSVYDVVGAGGDGPPTADAHGGATALLQTVRAATPRRRSPAGDNLGRPRLIHPVFPVPGDVRGLPAGTRFEHDALAAGEAVIVGDADGSAAVGLVPEFVDTSDDADDEPSDALSWSAHRLSRLPAADNHDLGEAEYTMRSAVRSAAEALERSGVRHRADADPRRLVAQLLESVRHHRVPVHAPLRAVRVLENAAHVDAIITVCTGLSAGQSSSEVQRTDAVLHPLAATVRSARAAAVDAILRSAWPG